MEFEIDDAPKHGLSVKDIREPWHVFLKRLTTGECVENDYGAYSLTMSNTSLYFEELSRVINNNFVAVNLRTVSLSIDLWPLNYHLLPRSLSPTAIDVYLCLSTESNTKQMAALLSTEKALIELDNYCFTFSLTTQLKDPG